MSDDLHRVLYTDADGHEQLTGAMTYDQAQSRARDLQSHGHTVGSVMGDVAARGYMHARYGTEHLSSDKPEPAGDPCALDLSMSPEVADYILRSVTGLLKDGYWPKSYTGYSPDDVDERDYDATLVLRAADIVGRENIRNRELRQHLAELDADDGSTT